MNKDMHQQKTRMDVLKRIVTGEGGLSDSILENNKVDAQMAVVSYSGSHDKKSWNDVEIICNWTSSKESLNSAVESVQAKGGTNCHAGLYHGAQILQSAREKAQKYVIFLSDGTPTYYCNNKGDTEGEVSRYDERAAQATKNQAKAIN